MELLVDKNQHRLWVCECRLIWVDPSRLRVSDEPTSLEYDQFIFVCPVGKRWEDLHPYGEEA